MMKGIRGAVLGGLLVLVGQFMKIKNGCPWPDYCMAGGHWSGWGRAAGATGGRGHAGALPTARQPEHPPFLTKMQMMQKEI